MRASSTAPARRRARIRRSSFATATSPPSARRRATPAPAGATIVDLTGKSVIPGLVMMHEHLYYTTGPGVYGQLGVSFSRLYLAGGVTTMRTGGKRQRDHGHQRGAPDRRRRNAGPAIDATAPYVNGPNTFLQMHTVERRRQARTHVAYWARAGRDVGEGLHADLARLAESARSTKAHKRGMKVTGHLCSVTYGEAADLGIDNLEHGFFAATDFVADKQPDVCPGQARGQQTIAALDETASRSRRW